MITIRNSTTRKTSGWLLAFVFMAGCSSESPQLDSDGGRDVADPGTDQGSAQDSTPVIPDQGSPLNELAGARRLQLGLAPADQAALAAGSLKRGMEITATVSFAVRADDLGKSGALFVSATDAELVEATPLDTDDSLASGALLLPFTVEELPPSGRLTLPFTFKAVGEAGAALQAQLRWPEETQAQVWLSFAIDPQGTLTVSDVPAILRDAYARLLAEPERLVQMLEVSQTISFAPQQFEQGYFERVDLPPSLLYPAECSQPGMICVTGRVAFDEPLGCGAPLGAQKISWSDCHRFKRHFDASGAAITANAEAAQALRPIAGTVEIKLVDAVSLSGPHLMTCGSDTVQTTSDGYFLAKLPTCNKTGFPALISAKVTPAFSVPQSSGTIRTVWSTSGALTVVAAGQSVDLGQVVYTDSSGSYSHPTLLLSYEIPGGEPATGQAAPHLVPLGTQVLLPPAAGDSFNYVREAFSAHQTTVELHLRLRDGLADGDLRYEDIFAQTPWANGYTLFLAADWPHGGLGFMGLIKPSDDPNSRRLLSHTDLVAHELGHSIHAAFAPQSLKRDYSFANMLTTKSGEDYDWGHGPGQYQELGVTFIEGLASGLGQYLLNGCGSWAGQRGQGGASPFWTNMWNGDDACDADRGCTFHHFRWQMKQRGVTEGSATWDTRQTYLQKLTDYAVQAEHKFVTSNSEGRMAELICDLLDTSSSITHVGPIHQRSYVPNFTGLVGQILDGVFDELLFTPLELGVRQFQAAEPETIQLELEQLLDAARWFCDNGCQLPQSFGAAYTAERLTATSGRISAQQLVRYLVELGRVTAAQGSNLLRTNYMEEEF